MTPTRRHLPSVTLCALFALLLLIAVSVTAAVHAAAKPSESQERGGPAFASDATWSPQHLRWTLSAEEMTYRFTRQPAVSVADTSEHLSSRDQQQPQSVSTRSVFRTLLTVDLKKRFQSIVGFGGAVTEAAADNIAQLPEDVQEAIAEAYFGPTGNRYSLVRVPINSCDFSPSSYSFDDKWDDVDLLAFDSRVQHDNRTMLPFIQRALRHSSNGIRLFASPWSPPAWMKNNYQMTGSSNPCLRSNDAYHRAWANYFVKFIRAYESYGVHIWGLTVQNEPEFAAPWEACTYTAEQQRDFVADFLGPIVHDAYPDVNIMTYDHNKDHVVAFTDVVYADERASKHLWGSAVHWYSGDQFDQLAVLHDKWPNKHILATEACHCPNVHLNSWKRAELYAHDVIGDLNNFVTGWTDWNLVLDQHGGPNHLGNMCDSPMIARLDFDPPTVHFQPMYYFLAHFTRFLPPGSVRIEHRLKGLSKDGDGSRQQQQQQASQQHDLGAASMSAPQSADPFASGGTGLEVVTFLVDPKTTGPVESPHGDTGKHVVIVVQNPTDRAEELVLQLSATRSSLVEIPAHSLSTFTARAEWFE